MGDIQRKDWDVEQERVNFVTKEIDKKANKLKNNAGKVSSDVLEIRKTFWNDVTVNFDEPDDVAETAASIKQQAELLSERERTNSQLTKQLRTLARLKDSPYFGRIDFLENGEKSADRIYLGIASFMDEHDENFIIYDWRAPISSLYYDYAPGPAFYDTPEGTISGEMELKRQFIIRGSKIKGMFEAGVTIGDEMLQEVLGNNANSQMKSIVATIQREQNQIIRNEHAKLLIVQGVAGSGKTSAALQRVAYLLYRYRDTLRSENILLFSPNPLFNSYVATVLPELGEENMQQSTFQEYLNQRIGREFTVEDQFEQMEFLLSNGEKDLGRINGIRFKASLDFKQLIDQYVSSLSTRGLLFKDIIFRNEVIISKAIISKYFYSLDQSFSIPNRMELVKDWILKELKKRVKKERSTSWVEEEIQFLEKGDYVEAFKHLEEKKHYTSSSFDDFDQEQRILAEMVVKEKFKPLFKRIKKLKFIDLPGIYQQLFSNEEHVKESFSDNWDTICYQTITNINNLEIPFEDATPFVYLKGLLEGRISNNVIRHIFIDEAQDYSPFQFAFIQQLFPNSKMTLLGDVNQAIFSGAIDSGTVLSDLAVKDEEVETYILMKTYRSTKPIVEFTSCLLEYGGKIQPFNRPGKKPTVKIVNAQNELNSLVVQKIEQFQSSGHQTIAVICRTAQESKQVYDILKMEIQLNLIEKGTISYEKGILVIPSYLAKGIEFDAVIIYDSSQYSSVNEQKLFYTVCTRAMHELYLFARGALSPLLKNVDPKTFDLI
ncbi:RNA polymerase recycling motor HelD [Bacillus sp. EB600]|uniref:RNA polymerase recycling motor HelD n=1 Tax=Bacillus sp. EB600 TaxID=2806345 RepID=UPI00210C094A|nr:RNA polymerase recycling motor HelD [Bacillus sp. EB600]MCQ6280549.1 AAA family ATPase [Bacillus sp. EB600]